MKLKAVSSRAGFEGEWYRHVETWRSRCQSRSRRRACLIYSVGWLIPKVTKLLFVAK